MPACTPQSQVLKATVLATLVGFIPGGQAMAADYKANPFTLTYNGAIMENTMAR